MDKNEIKKEIIDFIENKIDVKLPEQILESQDSLLNPRYGIEPRDLLMIVLELEKKFSIAICEKDVTENRLDYIGNLCDWIYACVK